MARSRARQRRFVVTALTALVLSLAAVAPARAALTERVSVSSLGVQANIPPEGAPGGVYEQADVSGDGHHVAFTSSANNLVLGDSNGRRDVFLHDRDTGSTQLVSGAASGHAGYPAISASGRYVAYAADSGFSEMRLFRYDRVTGQTEEVVGRSFGQTGSFFGFAPSISASGRHVAFYAGHGTLLEDEDGEITCADTNNNFDVYVFDFETEELDCVSGRDFGSGFALVGGSVFPSISGDGRYVAFVSGANSLVDGDTNNLGDVFVHDRETHENRRVNVSTSGEQADGWTASTYPQISADGDHVAFHSRATNLVSGDTNGHDDVFVHDLASGLTERVSVSSSGAQADGPAFDYGSLGISSDGQSVTFAAAATNLVAPPVQGTHVFVRRRATDVTELASVSSNGTPGDGGGYYPSMSASGQQVAFISGAANLVSGDTNEREDAFVHDWDGTAPPPDPDDVVTAIDSGPAGPTTDPRPTFGFSATPAGASFECRLYARDQAAPDFGDCSGPGATHAPSADLRAGEYAFEVRATSGGATDPSPARREFDVVVTTEVTITNAPASPTRNTTDTFGYTTVGTPPAGFFECSLDGAPFEQCDPPRFVTVGDGEHVFRVHHQRAGVGAGPAAEHRWTVDATPPQVLLERGPPADGNPPQAEFVFRSSEPDGATFACRLDGGPQLPCASPHHVQGLAPGAHRLAIVARDALGNESQPLTVDWIVGEQGGCGSVAVRVGAALACGEGLSPISPGSPIHDTSETAWVGGFQIHPRPGGRLIVDPTKPELRSAGAGVDVIFLGLPVPIAMSAIPVALERAEFDLGGAGTLEGVLGLPFEATAALEWTDGGAASALTFEIDLERLVEPIGVPVADGDAKETRTGTLEATLTNGKGFELTKAKIEANAFGLMIPSTNQIYIFRDVAGSYELVDGKAQVSLQGGVEFPLGKRDLTAHGKLSLHDSSLAGVGLGLSGFDIPIGGALTFTKLEGELQFHPAWGFSFGVGGRLGPKIAGQSFAELEGTLSGYALARDCRAKSATHVFQLDLVADMPVVARFGDAELAGRSCLYGLSASESDLSISFGFGERVGGAWTRGLSGRLRLVASDTGLGAEGDVIIKLPALPDIAGSLVLSTEGLAACGQVGFVAAGVAVTWGQGFEMFTGCDLSRWRARIGEARSLGAAASGSVTVPSGLPFVGFRAQGANGAPRVRITGPAGERHESPADGGFVDSGGLVMVHDEEQKLTYVFVRKPRPGKWLVEELDPGNPIERVSTAEGLPRPKVTARVARPKKGASEHVLSYSVKPMAGQRVVFSERGPGIHRTLGSTTKRSGSIRFVPTPSPERAREIEALVIQDGLPRASLTVARFTAAAQAAPPAPRKLKAKRKGTTVSVSFAKVKGAIRYLVAVKQGKTALPTLLTRKPRASVPGVPAGKATITVRAIVPNAPRGKPGKVVVKK